MAKKRKTPIEKGVEELIIKTVKEAKNQERGPGSDKLLAIARLLNSYARLCGGGKQGKSGPPSRESMSESEWLEYCMQHGTPGHYESLLE